MHMLYIHIAKVPDLFLLLHCELGFGSITRHMEHTLRPVYLTCIQFVQWWNPTVEEQAIDRAHRIGQTRTVHVTRITIAGKNHLFLTPGLVLLSDNMFAIPAGFDQGHDAVLIRATACLRAKLLPVVIQEQGLCTDSKHVKSSFSCLWHLQCHE